MMDGGQPEHTLSVAGLLLQAPPSRCCGLAHPSLVPPTGRISNLRFLSYGHRPFPLLGDSRRSFPPSRSAVLRVDLNHPDLSLGQVSIWPQIVGKDPPETRRDHMSSPFCISLGSPRLPLLPRGPLWVPTALSPWLVLDTPLPLPTPPLPALPRLLQTQVPSRMHCSSLQLSGHTLMSRSVLMDHFFPSLVGSHLPPNKAAYLSTREFSGTRREPQVPDATHHRLSPFPHLPLGAQISP